MVMDVDEHHPFGEVVEDAHETARAMAGGPCRFVTCEIPHQMRSVGEVIQPIMDRALRLSHVEGPLKARPISVND